MAGLYDELTIFTGNSNPELAEEICAHIDIPLGRAEVFKFANDNTFVRILESVRENDVFVVQTFAAPINDAIMEMLILIDTLKRASAGRVTAVIPYFGYGRTDKKDQPRVPITARLVAKLVGVAGADRVLTLDLHAGQIQGFFSIPGDVLTSFHILSDYFLRKTLHDPVIVTADLGFAKKGRNFAAKLRAPMAFVEKRRRGNDSMAEALTVIGDVDGRDVVIVDDEVDTGGSVCQAVEIVKEHGARDIYLSFVHPVLSHPAVERLRALPVKEIVTTNTIPLAPEKRLPNMTILSIGPLLAEVIRRAHEGRSVGEMFNE